MTELLVRVGEPRKGCSCLTCGTHIRWRGGGVHSRDIRKESRMERDEAERQKQGREDVEVVEEAEGADHLLV